MLTLAAPSLAATPSFPIPVEGAKTTITLQKNSTNLEIERIDFENEEYTVLKGRDLGFWEIDMEVYYSDGSSDSLDPDDVNFNSSNESIFTVDDSEIFGESLGSATLIAEYQGYTTTATIRVVEPNADVTIDLPEINQGEYPELDELQYLDEDYYEFMDVDTDYDEDTNTLLIYGIDWTAQGPFIGYIQQGNWMYKVEIDQSDRGNIVPITINEDDYTEVNFDIPAQTSISQYETIVLTALDGNNEPMATGTFDDISAGDSVHVPKGIYGMQVTVEEGNDAYNLFTEELNFTSANDVVMFAENDVANITFNNEISGNVVVNEVALCNFEYVNTCYHVQGDTDIDNLYTTIGDYDFFMYEVVVDNEWAYEFETDVYSVSGNQIVTIDDKLKTDLKFNLSSYIGGERVRLGGGRDGVLEVTDSYGNKLQSLRYNNEKVPGVLTFKNGTQEYKVQVLDLTHPSITLPNAEGTFEVTFTLGGQSTVPDPGEGTLPDLSGEWADWENSRVVNAHYQWTVEFNDSLASSDVNNNNFFVVDADGYLVEGVSVALLEGDPTKVLVSAPDSGYEAGQRYTLYIRDDVQSESGKGLTKGIKMGFDITN